jgi:hypothetical protein
MSGIEWKRIAPDELVRDIEASINQNQESKYDYQVGLKDLDFDLDEDKLQILGLKIPFQGINQAELALCNSAIRPTTFTEYDDTHHQVLAFDHRPVGYSGFMDCVTHSLALTNLGLFEVGRYPAVSQVNPGRYWQWFLHRRLATIEEVRARCESQNIMRDQFLQDTYQFMVNK